MDLCHDKAELLSAPYQYVVKTLRQSVPVTCFYFFIFLRILNYTPWSLNFWGNLAVIDALIWYLCAKCHLTGNVAKIIVFNLNMISYNVKCAKEFLDITPPHLKKQIVVQLQRPWSCKV